ncbi:tetratricopeptide repeat-containing glycosyltransferase family 2 protein [Paenibacillus sp. MMS18-CY102]|uniref:tetratricopeptide repeat-containing glycosyltransferase family 2 protein n=1 Tax=Paenibacillus sp. MMS18-CY102 TaxID=2682849 RepID=UPI0013658F3C|nr:glycosyltransferase family 2 protein [Paenibacillus sp. MMS18-CY102]MWC27350.1 glycosyltransferase [Paenibacillus sp. MMS18-CY102]
MHRELGQQERPGVSLCMIVRNEEAFIADCLASAAPYVSEMIVCDTGSDDRTVEIARGYGARVVSIPWDDDFAAARNVSLGLALYPWILVLDADERLEGLGLSQWSRLLCDEKAAGYYVRLISALERPGTESREGMLVTDAVCRLFRNDAQIRFSGIVHEECATAVACVQGGPVAIAPVTVRHEGYRADVIAGRRKPERNARLLAKALDREPGNVTLRYAVGTELLGAGRWVEAIEWLAPLAEGLGEGCGFASDIRLKLSHANRLAGRLEAAIVQAEAGVREYPDFPDMYEALAAAYMALDDAPSALHVLEQAIEIGPAAPYYSSVEGAGSSRSHYAAGAACERLYRWRDAAAHYRAALDERPTFEAAKARLRLLASGEGGRRAALEALRAGAAEAEKASGVEDGRADVEARKASGVELERVFAESSASGVEVGLAEGEAASGMEVGRAGAEVSSLELGAAEEEPALAVGLRAVEAGRWAEATRHFAVAHGLAATPAEARAAAAGLAAAFAARALAALEGSAASSANRGALAGHPRCLAELRLIVLTAIDEP